MHFVETLVRNLILLVLIAAYLLFPLLLDLIRPDWGSLWRWLRKKFRADESKSTTD
jgi:hypothetical protein